MNHNEEREIITKVSLKTVDPIFKKLSNYEYLNLTDILLIRYAILNDIITEEEAIEMLDKSDSVDHIKEYIQSMDAVNKTKI